MTNSKKAQEKIPEDTNARETTAREGAPTAETSPAREGAPTAKTHTKEGEFLDAMTGEFGQRAKNSIAEETRAQEVDGELQNPPENEAGVGRQNPPAEETAEEKQNPLILAQKKYKHIELQKARERFKNEYFSHGKMEVFRNFAQDSTLKIDLAEDKDCPTAYINPENGNIRVGKSIVLACLDGEKEGDEMFNYGLLTWILGHEISHFKDLLNPDRRNKIVFAGHVERYKKWLEDLNARIHKKWKDEFGKIHEGNVNDKSSPLHHIYHQFLNMLDDCVVNKMALGLGPLVRNLDIGKVYRDSLFTQTDYSGGQAPKCMQLGYYIIQKIMNPEQEIQVDDEVAFELEREYDFNEGKRNLLYIMQYLVHHCNSVYGANRYTMYYLNNSGKYFIEAFERLMDKDKENAEKMKEFMEQVVDEERKKQGEGEPKDGDPMSGTPNPFAKPIEDAKKRGKKTSEERDGAIESRKNSNENASKTDSEKLKDEAKKRATNFAGANNLDIDKTARYFEVLTERKEEIEMLANFIRDALLRNKTDVITILEKGKKSGSLIVNALIAKYPGLIAGEKEHSGRVFKRKVLLEEPLKRAINMKLRLLIDNSGSMSGVIRDLEEIFVIVNNALRLAEFKLIEFYGQEADLNSEMILFGDEYTEGVEKSGGRRIKKSEKNADDDAFHKSLIEAFSLITCDEGTDDSDAWRRISNEWFQKEEVAVSEGIESISLAMELTDGYVDYPEETENWVKRALDKGINASCVFLESGQALDTSEMDVRKALEKELSKAIESEDKEQITRLKKEIKEKVEEYRRANAELVKSTPSAFWGERFYPIDKVDEIISILMVMIMDEVNRVDEKLGLEPQFNLVSDRQKLETKKLI